MEGRILSFIKMALSSHKLSLDERQKQSLNVGSKSTTKIFFIITFDSFTYVSFELFFGFNRFRGFRGRAGKEDYDDAHVVATALQNRKQSLAQQISHTIDARTYFV